MHLNTQDFHIRTQNEFGNKIAMNAGEKCRVAAAVVKNILCAPGQALTDPVFFSDGSSSSYVFSEFLATYLKGKKEGNYSADVKVLTNNLDVPLQREFVSAEQRFDIEVAGGSLMSRVYGTFGATTEAWARANCEDCICVMSVSGLDAVVGPSEGSRESRLLKKVIMQVARTLIIVADSSKLCHKQNSALSVARDEWQKLLKTRKGDLWVCTTQSPHMRNLFTAGTKPVFSTLGVPDKRDPDEIEYANLYALKNELGQHLILV